MCGLNEPQLRLLVAPVTSRKFDRKIDLSMQNSHQSSSMNESAVCCQYLTAWSDAGSALLQCSGKYRKRLLAQHSEPAAEPSAALLINDSNAYAKLQLGNRPSTSLLLLHAWPGSIEGFTKQCIAIMAMIK